MTTKSARRCRNLSCWMRLVADDRSHSLVGLAKRTDRVEGDVGWKGQRGKGCNRGFHCRFSTRSRVDLNSQIDAQFAAQIDDAGRCRLSPNFTGSPRTTAAMYTTHCLGSRGKGLFLKVLIPRRALYVASPICHSRERETVKSQTAFSRKERYDC